MLALLSKQIISDDVKRQTAQVVDSAVQARIDSEVERLGSEAFGNIIARSTTPTGVVIASALECKSLGDNWSLYEPAEGRFILGAGKGPLESFVGLDTQGGAESHRLTLEEMPSHDHREKTGLETEARHLVNKRERERNDRYAAGIRGEAGEETGRSLNVSVVSRHEHPIEPSGGRSDGSTEPHNNMPPYVALYFCKHDGTG